MSNSGAAGRSPPCSLHLGSVQRLGRWLTCAFLITAANPRSGTTYYLLVYPMRCKLPAAAFSRPRAHLPPHRLASTSYTRCVWVDGSIALQPVVRRPCSDGVR